MTIGFITPSISRKAGGIFEIERRLAQELHKGGVEIEIFGLNDEFTAEDANQWTPLNPKTHPVSGVRSFGYSPALLKGILESPADLMHLHALWMHTSVVTRRWHLAKGKPYVVTPNGMLEPWALSNSGFKKKIAGFLYEDRMLHRAACLQANTEKELRDFRAYGLKNPVCVIPNGVDLLDTETLKTETLKSGRKILLFLGRLHPKKGLVNALRAWAKIRGQGAEVRSQEEWQFVVAGWDQGGHEAELKRLCKDLGLSYSDIPAASFLAENLTSDLSSLSSASVVFVGPAFGEHKDALLRRASAFILPSFSEGLPMSVLEAWSYRLPVLMTENCNIPEGFVADAALRIGTDVENIAEGLSLLFRAPISTLRSLGENGRTLVERQFAWPQIAAQMKEVYDWVLGGGEVPGCVRKF